MGVAAADFAVRFISSGEAFHVVPRTEPAEVLVEDKEIRAEPPFRVVGVLEVEGKETGKLAAFVERAQDAGASFGCSVLVERDAFELGSRVQRMIIPGYGGRMYRGSLGRDWHRSDRAVWQFLCGVPGADEEEQARTMKRAVSLAVELRRKHLGGYEPCEPYIPTGSHIRRGDVCTNDPNHHSEADGRSSVSYAP